MKTVRNLMFLVIVGIAFAGRSETVVAAPDGCELTISGDGNCQDMFNGIYWFIEGLTEEAHGGTCSDYCYYVPLCNEDAQECWPLWWDPEYCVEAPDQDVWYCNCLCMQS